MMKRFLLIWLVGGCLAFQSYAMNDSSNRTRPFSRLQFAIDGKKFHVDAYMRCRISPTDDWQYRHMRLNAPVRVHFECGKDFSVNTNLVVYGSITNVVGNIRSFFLTPETNYPSAFIRDFK